ncbi:MAG: hypothetical protein ACOX30_00995 [Dethiobacteria bacterium]
MEQLIWLDLAVVSLILRGAISGYRWGWRRALGRLGALLCAALTALLGRGDLKYFGARHGNLEKVIETAVHSRLALPVSAPVDGAVRPPGLPGALWQALYQGAAPAADPGNLATLLTALLGHTVAFLAGLALWWGFFHLCGAALADKEEGQISIAARRGGAMIGMAGQLCCAAIIIGVALPLAWLGGVPQELLQIEETRLACLAWNIFAALKIW